MANQRKGKVDYSTFLKSDDAKGGLTALQLPKLNVTKKRKAEELDAENIDPQSDAKTAIKKLKKSTSMKELPLQEATNTSRESSDEDELKAKLSAVKSKFKRLKTKYDEMLEEKKKTAETQVREIESATADYKKKVKQLELKVERMVTELEETRTGSEASAKQVKKLEKERDQLLAEQKKKSKDDQESAGLRKQIDELKAQNKKLMAAQQSREDEVQDLKRDIKRMKREHDEQLRAQQSAQNDDESSRVLELWGHIMRVSSDQEHSYICVYKNVQQTRALMFELTTGLKDDMVQYKPVFTEDDSIDDVEQVKRESLPDYLRNEIFFKQETLSVFLSKLFAFLNSRAATDASDSE